MDKGDNQITLDSGIVVVLDGWLAFFGFMLYLSLGHVSEPAGLSLNTQKIDVQRACNADLRPGPELIYFPSILLMEYLTFL